MVKIRWILSYAALRRCALRAAGRRDLPAGLRRALPERLAAITLAFALRTGLVFFFFAIFAIVVLFLPDLSLPEQITPLDANSVIQGVNQLLILASCCSVLSLPRSPDPAAQELLHLGLLFYGGSMIFPIGVKQEAPRRLEADASCSAANEADDRVSFEICRRARARWSNGSP